VIGGIRALIAPEALQCGTPVLVDAVLARSTPESFAAFEKFARATEQVLDCVLVAGEVDYFLRIASAIPAAFNHLHRERIMAMPGVR
jgi:Lrp/AsnC family leucine-responsive transcriptional regulator